MTTLDCDRGDGFGVNIRSAINAAGLGAPGDAQMARVLQGPLASVPSPRPHARTGSETRTRKSPMSSKTVQAPIPIACDRKLAPDQPPLAFDAVADDPAMAHLPFYGLEG